MLNKHFLSLLPVLCVLAFSLPAMGGEIRGVTASASSFKEWGVPKYLVDGDLSTAWVGGRKGVGPGKSLSFTLPKARKIGMIRVANGNQGDGLFKSFRTVANGILVLPDHGTYFFSLKPEAGEQDIVFPPVTVKSFDLIIAEVSPPPGDSELGDAKVAVSEVRVFSGAEAGVPVSVSAVSSSSNGVQPEKAAVPKVTKISRFSAISPGYFYMKVAVPVAAGTPESGIINAELSAGFINRIRSYFMRLITMQDSLAEVFAPSIREREAGTLELIRETMRKKGRLDLFEAASVDVAGLSMDRPIVRGDAAMVRVHGPLFFTSQGKTYENRVDMQFSFERVDGVWLINGARKK
ncbi:NADase-type glycan-binding domain-containing protein [uncultured Pseudodesulfovibrio sp.]|uniref:NADase-type glycan-binding domain-containing protein n=1 Tax=uncultured Pseudodesulfovibrio sp. TaxID=2035858 RepID=UPI0029C6E1E5|nr:hypothetical protein [uncultured Pseudodesulfovibrio sp.]